MATPISGYGTTRITGLASNMDTDTLVSNMMKTEQMKYDRIYKQNTKLEWKRAAYADINTKLKTFRDKFMSVLSPDNIMSQNVYRAYKVSYTENKYVDIKATSGASIGSHRITGVSLADYARMEGEKHRNRNVMVSGSSGTNFFASTSGDKVVAADAKIGDVFAFEQVDQQLSFSINGETFTFRQDEKIEDVINAVNANGKAGVNMSLNADGKILIANKENGNKDIRIQNGSNSPKVIETGGIFGSEATVKAKNILTSNDMTLGDFEAATGKSILDGGNLSFKINGQQFSFSSTDSIQDVLDTVNANTAADVTMTYDLDADKFIIRNNSAGSASKLELESGVGKAFGEDGLFAGINAGTTSKYENIDRDADSIKSAAEKMGVQLELDGNGMFSFTLKSKNSKGEIISKDFSFDPSKTSLKSMMDKVNADSELNVKMSYSQITDSFTFTSGSMGETAWVSVENKDGSNAFGDSKSFFGVAVGEKTGKDAELKIDGEVVKRSSNSFVLDGIEFNLKMEMADVGTDDEKAISFSLSQDIDSVVTKVKAFVEEYNKLYQELNGLYKESYDYKKGYEPLTEEEKKGLTEKEIEKLEAEARKGQLRNDTTINGLLSSMRSALFEKVGDTGLSPHDIGLSTGTWSNEGQISFDETKFRAALKENPDAVGKVMAGVSDSTDSKVARENSGLVSRFFDTFTTTQNTLTKTNIKNIDQNLSDNDKKMSDMMDRMYEMEERYYIQFAQMEKLLSQYQQQSAWLSQQLAGM